MRVGLVDVERLLNGPIGLSGASEIALIGQGAWSMAFGFVHDSRELVIRIGAHVADFRCDEAMSSLAAPSLPIPEVLGIGQIPSGDSMGRWYCISARVPGEPLESCSSSEWPMMAERLAEVLEAMRRCTPHHAAESEGLHRPDVPGTLTVWREQLLAIERDDLDPRNAGWRVKLARSARGRRAFETGMARLAALELGEVPLTLVHGDLLNKNVHIEGGRITGVFDWGCQRWGDHLFDLSWFVFWAPWHPNLEVAVLQAAVERRWAQAGFAPEQEQNRRQACLTYIGLEHLIYNATVDRWGEFNRVIDRMAELDLL